MTCGYELKGLSIRSVCPECGTAVRATILYKVDPQAEEFKPIPHRRMLAAGLALWSAGPVVAAIACWALRITDQLGLWMASPPALPFAAWIAVAGVVVSGIGALALIRPVPGAPRGRSLQALIGCAAYAPLVWAMWRMLLDIDPRSAPPYFAGVLQPDRILLRFIASACIIVILLGIRPGARELVKRCMVMRTGRVDRQTLLGMAAVAAVTMVGDGIRLAAANQSGMPAETWSIAGSVIIAMGSAMLTLGLIGAMVDSFRIARAVLIPAPSLRQVLGRNRGDESSS